MSLPRVVIGREALLFLFCGLDQSLLAKTAVDHHVVNKLQLWSA